MEETLFYQYFYSIFFAVKILVTLFMSLNQHIDFNRLPSPFSLLVFVTIAARLSPLEGIAHSDTDACFFEHREVVEVVPHGEGTSS